MFVIFCGKIQFGSVRKWFKVITTTCISNKFLSGRQESYSGNVSKSSSSNSFFAMVHLVINVKVTFSNRISQSLQLVKEEHAPLTKTFSKKFLNAKGKSCDLRLYSIGLDVFDAVDDCALYTSL